MGSMIAKEIYNQLVSGAIKLSSALALLYL